jgi:hypothetical protein
MTRAYSKTILDAPTAKVTEFDQICLLSTPIAKYVICSFRKIAKTIAPEGSLCTSQGLGY